MNTQTPLHQVLARKWRPGRFEDLVGQPHVVRALANALRSGRLHHAYLFSGTRGVGKTTVARILARCLNCEEGVSASPCGVCRSCVEIADGRHMDLIEVDAASRTGIDDTRELMDNVAYAPATGRFKIYLIDEVHMLSEKSFNALLKTLEEPPAHVKFLLATTDPQKLPVTVLSRCLQFNLKAVSPAVIGEHLGRILESEGIAAEPAALLRLAEAAEGSVRDALSLTDQAIAFSGGQLSEAEVSAMVGLLPRSHLEALLDSIWRRDGPSLVRALDELDALAPDWKRVLDSLAAMVHEIAILQVLPQEETGDAVRFGAASDWQRDMARAEAPEEIQLSYDILTHGRDAVALAPNPRIGAEMTLLRMLAFRPVEPEMAPVESGAAASPRAQARVANTESTPKTRADSRPVPRAEPRPEVKAEPRPEVKAEPVFDWHAFAVGLNAGPARELALNCSLSRLDSDRVLLGVAPAQRMMATKRVLTQLSASLSAELGRAVRIELQAPGKNEQDSPAARLASEEERTRKAAEQDLLSDPGLRALQESFGARIERVSLERGSETNGNDGRSSMHRST
jgi:DNA polymerase-3 subunit gamma/tau